MIIKTLSDSRRKTFSVFLKNLSERRACRLLLPLLIFFLEAVKCTFRNIYLSINGASKGDEKVLAFALTKNSFLCLRLSNIHKALVIRDMKMKKVKLFVVLIVCMLRLTSK